MTKKVNVSRQLFDGSVTILVFIYMIFCLFPFFWIVATSIKPALLAFQFPPVWFFSPTLENYVKLVNSGFFYYYLNSAIVGASATFLSIVIGVPAAYALERFKGKRTEDYAFFVLSQRFAPPTLVIIPIFIIVLQFKLVDKLFPLVIMYITLCLPFVIWMVRTFFREVPRELFEAARVDGCNILQTFWRIELPLARGGILASAIFCLIMCWNEFIFALILTKVNARTAPVAITSMITYRGIEWGLITAATVMVSLPIIVFALLLQKNLVKGLTMGAIKG